VEEETGRKRPIPTYYSLDLVQCKNYLMQCANQAEHIIITMYIQLVMIDRSLIDVLR
jgi:hypothetical protein